MSDRHLHPVAAPTTTPANDISRRVALLHQLAPYIDVIQPRDVETDADRHTLLSSLLGDIADAYRFGHSSVTDEVQRLAAAALRILLDDMREQAR